MTAAEKDPKKQRAFDEDSPEVIYGDADRKVPDWRNDLADDPEDQLDDPEDGGKNEAVRRILGFSIDQLFKDDEKEK